MKCQAAIIGYRRKTFGVFGAHRSCRLCGLFHFHFADFFLQCLDLGFQIFQCIGPNGSCRAAKADGDRQCKRLRFQRINGFHDTLFSDGLLSRIQAAS